jgi:hypothetical protein
VPFPPLLSDKPETEEYYLPTDIEQNKIGIAGLGLPPEVLFNPCLLEKEKILFGFIRLLSQTSRGCYASNNYLSELLLCSEQYISNGVKKLSQLGYINIKLETRPYGGKTRQIFINENYKIHYRKLIEKVHEYLYSRDNENNTRLKLQLFSTITTVILDYNYSYRDNDIDNYINNYNFINKINNDSSDANASSKSDIDYKETAKRSRRKINENLQDLKSKKRQRRRPIRQTRNLNLANDIIKRWNSFPTTTTHSIDPSNKTYLKIQQHLIELMSGSFAESKHWNKSWQKSIPQEYFNGKKWSVHELDDAVINLAKYTMEGYWPSEGKQNFKSLLICLYNERTGKSMLFQAYAHPPLPISESDDKLSTNETISNLQKVILEYIGHDHNFRMKNLENCIVKIIDYFNRQSQEIQTKMGPPVIFLRYYGDWLQENWPNVDPSRIAPGSRPFELFEEWLHNEQR